MIKATTFVCGVLLCALLSCDKNEHELELRPKINVSPKVVRLSNGGRGVQLDFKTQTAFPCANFEIDFSYSIVYGKITIDFKNTIVPPYCVGNSGPATAFKLIDDLLDGEYNIEFKCNGRTDKGKFWVHPLYYKFEMENDRVAVFDKSVLII